MTILSVIFLFIIFVLFYNIKELRNITYSKYNCQKISVIIPARNEAINLPSILSSLQNQNIYEIILVNDGSTDSTATIANSFNVKIINIDKCPDGWAGKNYACYVGAQNSTGDILLFLDSDLTLNSNAIKKLISSFDENSVLSVQPYHHAEKLYEKFSLFFNIISVAAVGLCLPGKDKSIGLFGPVFMVSKKLYFSFGGHELVKNEVMEDYKLGQLLRKKGIKCNLFLGINSISYKMYKGGLGDLVWGWSKNFASGAVETPILYLIPVFLWVSSYYSISMNLIKNSILFFINTSFYLNMIFYFLLYLLASLFLYIKAKKIGSFSLLDCFFHIIYLLAFTLIFIFSLILKFIIRKVKWKGRWYKI